MNDKSILIVDDDSDLLVMIKTIFERAGFTQVKTMSSSIEAFKEISVDMPDMIILDVVMPHMNGFELLQKIRAISSVPVLMLTARGESDDLFAGFEYGADDYVVKPFLPKELLLRVQAILKRVYHDSKNIITLDACTVDLDTAEVIHNNTTETLTAKEYKIFLKLCENPGRIVTIGSLCQAACGDIWLGYESTLMTHIRHLREKIERNPSCPTSLLTVKGLGYKLIIKR